MIDIRGLDKAEVLAALYNASHAQGMGFLHFTPERMTKEEAANLLKETSYFDYVKGRILKISLQTDDLEERLYDRDNGSGAAYRALEELLTRPKAKS